MVIIYLTLEVLDLLYLRRKLNRKVCYIIYYTLNTFIYYVVDLVYNFLKLVIYVLIIFLAFLGILMASGFVVKISLVYTILLLLFVELVLKSYSYSLGLKESLFKLFYIIIRFIKSNTIILRGISSVL